MALRFRGWLRGTAITTVILVVLAVRVELTARGELERAERLVRAGNEVAAITHYRRAASLYVPASPTAEAARQSLLDIAGRPERAGDRSNALAALRAFRSAALASRSIFGSDGARLDAVDRRLADVVADQTTGNLAAGAPRRGLPEQALATLVAARGPQPWFLLVALIGYAFFIGSVVAFLRLALDEEDRWQGPAARRWGTAALCALGLFVAGLTLA